MNDRINIKLTNALEYYNGICNVTLHEDNELFYATFDTTYNDHYENEFGTAWERKKYIAELLEEAVKHFTMEMIHCLISDDSEYYRYKRMLCLALLHEEFKIQ